MTGKDLLDSLRFVDDDLIEEAGLEQLKEDKQKKTKGKDMQFIDSKGVVLKEDNLTLAEPPGKWRMLSTTTGTYINAGYYKVVLSAPDMEGLALDALDVQ